MKIEIVKCDQCGKEQPAGPTIGRFGSRNVEIPEKRMIRLELGLGPDWFSMTANEARASTNFDFCSEACVGKFIEARVSQTNVKVMAHPLARANVDRGVEVETGWQHGKQRG